MPQFFAGPIMTLVATKFPVTLPPTLLNQRVLGFDVQNFSMFDILITGIPGGLYHLEPYTGMYIPVLYATDNLQMIPDKSIVLQTGNVFWYPSNMWNGGGGHVDMTAVFQGDVEPELPLTPYLLPIINGLNTNRLGGSFFLATVQANSTAAHTNTMGPQAISAGQGGGFYLTYLSFAFGVPTAAINEDVLLNDINGATIMNWHLNMGVLPMPPARLDISFGYPGLLALGISGLTQSWSFVTPATANGPGYSINMMGYVV